MQATETHSQRQPHATKRGPGRRHKQGQKHGRAPVAPMGPLFGFVQHKASPEKALRRANVKALGRRQALKAAKRERNEQLPAVLLP